jgi:hypothetical protein
LAGHVRIAEDTRLEEIENFLSRVVHGWFFLQTGGSDLSMGIACINLGMSMSSFSGFARDDSNRQKYQKHRMPIS